LENPELRVTNSFLVERLIGMDFVLADVQLGIRTPTNGIEGSRIVLTQFGWIVVGIVPSCIS
jgi:hypothetical protein